MKGYEVRSSIDGTKCIVEVRLPDAEVIYRLHGELRTNESSTYCAPCHLLDSIDRLAEFPEIKAAALNEVMATRRAIVERAASAQQSNNTPHI